MTPLLCAARCHGLLGILAAVQPQEGLASLMTTSESETLVTVKANFATESPGLVVTSLVSASHARTFGGLAGLAFPFGAEGTGGIGGAEGPGTFAPHEQMPASINRRKRPIACFIEMN